MNKKDWRVLIEVNHKWRDLPGLAAIKVWLEMEHNCSVLLTPTELVWQNLHLFKPHIICMVHILGKGRHYIAEQAKQMGTLMAILPSEGRPNNEELIWLGAGCYTDLSLVDLHFVWNKFMYDAMVEHKTLSTERIGIAGNPRFDFYEYPLRTLVPPRESFLQKYRLDPERPMVTLATNFALTRFENVNRDFMLRDHHDLGVTKLPSYKDSEAQMEHDIRLRNQTLSALAHTMEVLPEINFVIKPHPCESHNYYYKFIDDMRKRGRENVILIYQEYIWTILNATDIHLHRQCTTGVEAWFFNKPSLELDLLPPPDHFKETALRGSGYEAMAGCDVIRNEEELIETIRAYIDGKSIPPDQLSGREAYINKWFYIVDGKRSRVYADELKRLLDNRRPQVTPPTDYERFQLINIFNQLQDRVSREKIDPTNLVDRTIAMKDVDEWDRKIRGVLFSTNLTKFSEEDESEKWFHHISSLWNKGRLLSDQGKYKEAIKEYEEAMVSCPKDVNIRAGILLQMGNVYFQQGELKKAEEKTKEALSLEFSDKNLTIAIVQIEYTMGSAYEKEGELSGAKEKFEIVIKLVKKVPFFDGRDRFIGGAHFHLGEIYLKLGRKEEAIREFEECVKFIPDHKKAKAKLVNE